MFYPELLQIHNENNLITISLIESIDQWLAFLPINEQNKITIRKCSNLLKIDYPIAAAILEKVYNLGIIKKVYAIKCPECGFILKLTDEKNFVDDFSEIKMHRSCYNCHEEIEEQLSMDLIEIRYELIKKPSRDFSEVKELAMNSLNIEVENDTIGDLIEKANHNANNLFYKPIEDDYQKLETLLCGVEESIVSKNMKTKEKGDRLENLVLELLNLVKVFSATKDATTKTNQIDCLVRNKLGRLATPSILNEMGHMIYCECKNEKEAPGNTYFHKLSSIMSLSQGKTNDRRFGIVFSRESAASTLIQIQKEMFLAKNIVLIAFDLNDLKRIIRGKTNLLDEIEKKASKVIYGMNQDLKNLNLM